MQHALAVAVLWGALAGAAEAQQSGKAVAVDAGSAPTANYVYVVCNGGNTVAVRKTDGTAVTTLTAAVFGFNAPYDVVASPSQHLVFVSNAGANPGTVTVIDANTLQLVQIVTVPTSLNLHGMSLSEDESVLFVAGQDAAGPAVFQVNTAAPFATARTGGVALAGGAEDCVVIRAANVGGSGNGPGRIYFSVPRAGAAGQIGIINVNPPSTSPPIQTGAGALASIEQADRMQRTPDHRFVFVGCSKILTFGTDVRIVRIDTSTNTATATIVNAGVQDLANNRSWDVTWTTAGGNNRGFVLIQQDNGTKQIREILDTGLPSGVALVSANTGLLTDPITLSYSAVSNQVFIGDIFGTNTGYGSYDASTTPLSGPLSPGGVGNRCQAFAVLPTPAVVVTDICPRAGLQGASMPVTIHGAGFVSGGTFNFGTGLKTITPAEFIDSGTLLVDLAGAPAGLVGITVNNPLNLQTATMDLFFNFYAAPEQRPAFTVALPSVSMGYRMMSMPQYSTLTALKSALAAALGPYNPVLYRVFLYRGGRYVELNGLADDGCDLAGESFWVLTRNGAVVTMSEPDVRNNDGGTNRVIPINPGFNMISLPTLNGNLPPSGSINWGSIQVSSTAANFTSGLQAANAAPTLLTPVALEYLNGGYVTADPLVAGRGYWVENVSGNPLYLVFPRASVFKPGVLAVGGGAPPPAGMNPPPPPSGISTGGARRSGGCGLSGLEWLLPILLVRWGVRRRRLPA
jgi:hypothetical protein